MVRKLRAKACIKPHKNRTRKERYDRDRYKHRNCVERFFGRIKQFRRAATRYEKTPENFLGFVWLAALVIDLLWMSTLPSSSKMPRVETRLSGAIPGRCELPGPSTLCSRRQSLLEELPPHLGYEHLWMLRAGLDETATDPQLADTMKAS